MVRPAITLLSGLVLAVSAGGAASAQPLYVGDQEFDTADRAQMSTLLEHCESLAADTPDVNRVAQFTAEVQAPDQPADEEQQTTFLPASPEESAEDEQGPIPVALDLEAAISSGDSNEPEGEGAGEGTDTQENDDEGGEQEDDDVDVQAVTLEACKEAGIVF